MEIARKLKNNCSSWLSWVGETERGDLQSRSDSINGVFTLQCLPFRDLNYPVGFFIIFHIMLFFKKIWNSSMSWRYLTARKWSEAGGIQNWPISFTCCFCHRPIDPDDWNFTVVSVSIFHAMLFWTQRREAEHKMKLTGGRRRRLVFEYHFQSVPPSFLLGRRKLSKKDVGFFFYIYIFAMTTQRHPASNSIGLSRYLSELDRM